MKFRKLNAEDIEKIARALDKAGENELGDYFGALLDSVYVDGNKRITFEP